MAGAGHEARDEAVPQHGMPEGVTSFAHRAATCSKAPVTPSFLDVQGTWMATLSFTCMAPDLH